MYDGQAQVVNNILEIPEGKEYWKDYLYTQGYEDYVEPEQVIEEEQVPLSGEPAQTVATSTRGRKKVNNGKSSQSTE